MRLSDPPLLLLYILYAVGRRSRAIRERRIQREHDVARNLQLLKGAADRGCLFCREGVGPFESVEHVFAESLGNRDLILPRGVVCDRCNNGTLSTLDQVLVEFMPVALRLTMLGVRNKSGKLKSLSLQGETYEHIPSPDGRGEPTLVVKSKIPGRHAIREIARFPDGRVQLQMSGSGGRRLTPRYASELSRAMLKSALECAWIDHGETMIESRFDHVREAVLGVPRDGFFMVAATSPDPNSTSVTLSYDLVPEEGHWRMPVWLNVYGVLMHTDSRSDEPPSLGASDNWNTLGFKASDLSVRRTAMEPARQTIPTPHGEAS